MNLMFEEPCDPFRHAGLALCRICNHSWVFNGTITKPVSGVDDLPCPNCAHEAAEFVEDEDDLPPPMDPVYS